MFLLLVLFVSLFPILGFLPLLHDLIDYLLLPLAAQLHIFAVPLDVIVRVRVLGEYLCDDQLGQLVVLDQPVVAVGLDVREDGALQRPVEGEVKQVHDVVVL